MYFGDNVWAQDAAPYFNRQPEKLTLSQSAMLAGLVQAVPTPRPKPQGCPEAGAEWYSTQWLLGFVSETKGERRTFRQSSGESGLPTGTCFAGLGRTAGSCRCGRILVRRKSGRHLMPGCSGLRDRSLPGRRSEKRKSHLRDATQ
ncbi:MAG: transglycosylase domain-containing protein [Sphingomonadales bacterium]|nr:transglycosylase domain-containing protein [Sphingomonadales bacterium]